MVENEIREIRGVIVPTAWDSQGCVLAVGLAGADEQEYHLAPGQPTAELLGLVQKEVVIRGRVLLLDDGRQQINVESLRQHVQVAKT